MELSVALLTIPINLVWLDTKLLAMALGRYPNSLAACITASRVLGDNLPLQEKARETVDWETPARLATSIDVTVL